MSLRVALLRAPHVPQAMLPCTPSCSARLLQSRCHVTPGTVLIPPGRGPPRRPAFVGAGRSGEFTGPVKGISDGMARIVATLYEEGSRGLAALPEGCAPAQRWPAFTPAALELGVRAVFAGVFQIGAIRLGSC